jgi:hypothetical protein
MSDLISREALLEFARNHIGGTVDCNDIARFPAVDAEPVRHGRWIERDGKTWCSLCGASNKAYKPPFCPHCGAHMSAKMDGGNTDE